MTEPERLVRFELLGQEFAFYTAASETELEEILALVQELMEDDASRSRATLPTSKVAVLACLNIASRYVKLQQDFRSYRNDMEARFLRLSKDIQNSLADD